MRLASERPAGQSPVCVGGVMLHPEDSGELRRQKLARIILNGMYQFLGLLDVAGSAHPIVALCMASFLAAVTQSPITSAVIVMEMINNHGMVVSLMAGALIARAVSSRFGPELYHRLSLGFLDRELKRLPANQQAASEATT